MQMQSPAPSFEIPAEMRAFAERSFEQARIAFDKFMETAQSTMNTLEGQSKVAQAGAKEISGRSWASPSRTSPARRYAQNWCRRRISQSLMALHSEFVQAQMQVLAEQARELTGSRATTARDALNRSPEGSSGSARAFRRATTTGGLAAGVSRGHHRLAFGPGRSVLRRSATPGDRKINLILQFHQNNLLCNARYVFQCTMPHVTLVCSAVRNAPIGVAGCPNIESTPPGPLPRAGRQVSHPAPRG